MVETQAQVCILLLCVMAVFPLVWVLVKTRFKKFDDKQSLVLDVQQWPALTADDRAWLHRQWQTGELEARSDDLWPVPSSLAPTEVRLIHLRNQLLTLQMVGPSSRYYSPQNQEQLIGVLREIRELEKR